MISTRTVAGVCYPRPEPADASLPGEAGRAETAAHPHIQLPPLHQARAQ